jgi:two-component system phosphate regulon response regulator OmpR
VAAAEPDAFISRHPGAEVWWLDDDIDLCRLVLPRLRASGWQVRTFQASELLQAALQQSRPDLLLLDRRLKEDVGTELLRQLRQQGEVFPVLILSGMGTPSDRILGLEEGAQDYMVKPFHPRELQLRCERLLQSDRRAPVAPLPGETEIVLGDVMFCPHQGSLQISGKPSVMLTRGEKVLLLALCRAPGRVLSRENLALASGSLAAPSSSRSIDVRLSRLRRLLMEVSGGALRIEAIRTQGYALQISAGAQEPIHGSEA